MDMEARKVGLVVSEDKTKYMVLDRSHGTRIGQNLTMNEYNFEVVQSFKYLDSIVNVANDLDEELKTRTIQANRCFYALKHLFRSKLLNIATKYRLYKTLVRTVAIYASETWTLTSNQENRLKCFERKIQRSICVPIKVDDMWRIRMNIELVEIFGRENIVSVIKSARLRWLGHVMRMSDYSLAKKVFVNNVEGELDPEADQGRDGLIVWKVTSKNWVLVIGKLLPRIVRDGVWKLWSQPKPAWVKQGC